MINRLIRFSLENKLVVMLVILFITVWGVMVAPFDWDIKSIPRDPVPVDAIPDIGENQQIVFTRWQGRSPQDVEDQITYPLTTSLLGMPGVKTIRSFSYFGFSTVYIIFNEDIEFYWSRSRVLEKLNSLPAGLLPDGVVPTLGPDATALGQVFWYTLEGRDKDSNPTGGWDLHELRSIQDWYVRYALQSVEGVAEVASIGGFVQEYQIDVDPDGLRAYGVSLEEVFQAIRNSNSDVGARSIEINKAEYVIRAKGFLKSVEDIENTVVKLKESVPVFVKNIAHVALGPALRRGALDKGGAEAVGGVVVVRYGYNPLAAIKNIKQKIEEISQGLPKKVLPDGTESQVRIIPFYDRTELIYETLGTLNTALVEEVLITVIVVLVMVLHLRSSILISGLLPIAILMCFIAMKLFGVDANVVALSGIAIAIGTMVDMGIVLCENILKHLEEADEKESRLEVIYRASTEVGSAILTAILTTVVSFLPVFTMEAAEGKLFKPLAFTKTFALLGSVFVALFLIPPVSHILFRKSSSKRQSMFFGILFILIGVALFFRLPFAIALSVVLTGVYLALKKFVSETWSDRVVNGFNYLVAFMVAGFLAFHWLPLGPEKGLFNLVFVIFVISFILGFFLLFRHFYGFFLEQFLKFKVLFLSIPLIVVLTGASVWLGVDKVFAFLPEPVKKSSVFNSLKETFPGLGKEFMPSLDEGAYLFMPTTMPHASIGEAMDVLQKQDMAIRAIPEIENVVGKVGRVESSLDPAPISMIETVITYKPEYRVDKNGNRLKFAYDREKNEFMRDEEGNLIPDENGRLFRQWREHIKEPSDIWDEIVVAASIPGTTSAPKLQPISARIVMLQSGMRAPTGLKIYGPDQKTIEDTGLKIEQFLKEVPLIEPATVIADRIIGKPYLEIEIDRLAIARYGISVEKMQNVIEVAIGGKPVTNTVEGRERYPVRVRYMRELRDSLESLKKILVTSSQGASIPLEQLASIRYTPGPMVVKSEDTFLTGYVLFDKKDGVAEVEAVEAAQKYLKEKIESGELLVPENVSYKFSGSYENQIRSEKRLMVVLPLALFVIFMILYFQFRSIWVTFLVFSEVFLAWAGGFIMLWLYSQDWFLNFSLLDINFRELFQVEPYNLSVAVWVGFLALFGIATDDAVIMATYLKQVFEEDDPQNIEAVRRSTVKAALRRIRPCLMTTATTVLALIPILTSVGRGSDVMVPMAIPSFGGMLVVQVSVFIVPVIFCWVKETGLKWKERRKS